MNKSEIYLREDQVRFLHDLSFLETRKRGKRVSMAQLIRDAVDTLIQKRSKTVHKETLAILSNPQFLKDIHEAHEDSKKKNYSTDTEEVFGA